MKKSVFYRNIVVCVCSLFFFLNTTGTAIHAEGTNITIKGSTTVLPIAQLTSEIFMEQNPGANISVQGGGSGVGITSLIEGTTDIADSSRKIKDKELKKAQETGIEPFENIVALDGIAVVVHLSNIKNYLTREQIKAIYTGKISNWSEIGGEDKKIVVISRDTSSGTYEAFENLALNKEKVRPDALITASNQAVNITIAQTPGAIGYLGLGYLTKKVKAVSVDGIKCTKETVVSGQYPLSRPLYMYTDGKPEGIIKQYLDFVLGPEGQKLIEEEGFVGIQ